MSTLHAGRVCTRAGAHGRAALGLIAAIFFAADLRGQCMQWTELSPSNPPPAAYQVSGAVMVYDKARHAPTLLVDYHPSYPNRLLVYTLSSAGWSLHNPLVTPTSVNTACYHDQRGTVIAWCADNQLWEWNGATWSLITHAGPWPDQGLWTFMTYDPARHRVILVSSQPATVMNETWEWTGTAWEQGPTVGPLVPAQLCFDVHRNVAFLLSEDPATGWEAYCEYTPPPPGATAAQGSWARISESLHYGFYEGGWLTYDPYRRQIMSGRGMQWSPPWYGNSMSYWDTSRLQWKGLDPGSGPQLFPYDRRRSHSAVCLDTDTGQIVLYGGRRHEFVKTGTNWTYYNDTWVFNRQDPGIVVDLPPTKNWCAGANGVLSISVAGNASVQWWKDNQPIPGATSTILVLGAVTPATAGVYECEVANSCGGLWSRPCHVSVTVPPAIVSQPIGQDRCPGEDVLIVGPGVTGTNPEIKLQWDNFGFWMNVPFQYNPVGNFYILPNAQNTQSGWYRFEASNGCGAAYTQPFHIQVGVMIYGGPVSVDLDPCVVHQYSVTAQGVGPTLTYEWRRDGVAIVDDGRITGATTPTLTINGVRYQDEGKYECRVTDACESRMSGAGWIRMKTPKWVHRTSSGPHRRLPTSTDLVYDAARGVSVLYGGSLNSSTATYMNDTWEWDGHSWTQRFPAHNPGPRTNHEMVYDSLRNKVLLLFGTSIASPYNPGIWEYDGNDWTLLTNAPGGPPFGWLSFGEAAFDPVRGKVIATDASSGGSTVCDTWEFDPTTLVWVRTVTGSAPSHSNHQMAWNSALGAVLSPNSWPWPGGGTLRYTGTSWTVQGSDPARTMPAIAFDTFRNRMTMFGCCRDQQNYWIFRTDTYAFNGAAWGLVLPEFHPTQADALWPVAMCFDTRRNAMVVIGNSYNTFVGSNPVETWEYSYADKVVLDRQPEDQPLVIGSSAEFRVLASAAGTPTYQWFKGATALVNGPTVKGGVISGAQTNTLTITGLTASDAGTYRCSVSNACGSALSDPADLGSVCYPDCNGDGAVTVADFGCFQTAFISGNLYADCNQSGTLTIADFGCFQTAFVVGCP